MNKDKVYLISILFFLTFLQNLNIEKLWGIDFLLIGILFFGFFVNFFWLITASLVVILLNLFISGDLEFFPALSYLFLPIFAKRSTMALNLNFSRYLILCLLYLVLYVLPWSFHIGLKNTYIIIAKNATSAFLIYLVFRNVASRPIRA